MNGLRAIFPFIQIVDDTTQVYDGPVYPGCPLSRKIESLFPGKEYLCTIFGPSIGKQPFLFMFNLYVEDHQAKVIMSFYPFKPEHQCDIRLLVDHLLSVIAIHNKNRRRVAAQTVR